MGAAEWLKSNRVRERLTECFAWCLWAGVGHEFTVGEELILRRSGRQRNSVYFLLVKKWHRQKAWWRDQRKHIRIYWTDQDMGWEKKTTPQWQTLQTLIMDYYFRLENKVLVWRFVFYEPAVGLGGWFSCLLIVVEGLEPFPNHPLTPQKKRKNEQSMTYALFCVGSKLFLQLERLPR